MDVTSPVAGAVQMFLVDDHVSVEEGEQVLVVEACKTQFYVSAPCAGQISLRCALGDVVTRGQVLCVIQSS